MVFELEFSDIGVGRWARWLLVYPLLGLAGCHMLMTGSPVLPFSLMGNIHNMRSIYEAAKSRVEQEPNLIRSFSRDQIDQ
jgi:hypothetical protein